MTLKNDLSKLSYTNKDFNAIYTELLEYAKKISYKWDPSTSDESDPGVVLLKLCAIIGDKDNYNIDKNTLELMPGSVTQEGAARQLFSQCGYTMKGYRSAQGKLTISLNKIPNDADSTTPFTLPEFTMFTNIDTDTDNDTDNNVVYTSIKEINGITYNTSIDIDVIEGSVTEYRINNDPVITLFNLDSKNRLYFTDKNIAENGIFVRNHKAQPADSDFWPIVDNIEIEPAGKKCFRFGKTANTNTCYIEFPTDVDLLFGQGITIHYIKSSGVNGNITAKKLRNVFNTTYLNYKLDDNSSKTYEVSSENMYITNTLPILNGQDPESIDSAYKSYKRVKDTFDTLVSLNDYRDYMIEHDYASNGYVCDRTNDIQYSYKINKAQEAGHKLETYVEEDSSKNPFMTAFDLHCYGLLNPTSINSASEFSRSFELGDSKKFIEDLDDEDSPKSIQHDFKSFGVNTILMIKNKYNIRATIIPKAKLSSTEQFEVISNIESALYKNINATKLEFGKDVEYDLIYESISTADQRIKAIILPYPTHKTYAITKNEDDKFVEVLVSEIDPDNTNLSKQFRAEIFAKNVLAGVTPLYKHDTDFTYTLYQENPKRIDNIEKLTTQTSIRPSTTTDNNKLLYEVRDNENICLYTPNYISEGGPYQNSVKFLYVFETSKGSFKKHTMKTKNEFIVFFWKPKDEDEVYTYRKYTCNSTANRISASFNIKPKKPDSFNYKTNIPSKYTDVYSWINRLEPDITKTLDSDLDLNLNDFVETLTQTSDSSSLAINNLFTGNSINMLKQNVVHVNNSTNGATNMYWILQTTDKDTNGNDVYTLFGENETTRTLRSGEYFFYTNANKTSLAIQGEGTTIERRVSTHDGSNKINDLDSKNSLTCRAGVTYDQIYTEGLDALEDYWKIMQLFAEGGIYVTENQQLVLGPESKMTLSLKSDTERDPNSPTDVKNITSTDANLTNYIIRYSTDDVTDSELEDLPWKARAILNLSASPNNPQKLLENQEVYYNDATEPIKGTTNSDTTIYTPIYIQSDKELILAGGEDIDVTFYDFSTKTTEPLSLLTYTYTPPTEDSGINIKDDTMSITVAGKTVNDRTEVDGSVTLSRITLLPGNYLLNVQAGDISNIKVYKNGSIDALDEINAGLCRLPISKNETSITLRFTNSSDEKQTLIIQPLYRYDNSNFTEVEGMVKDSSTEGSDVTTRSSEESSESTTESFKREGLESAVLTRINALDPDGYCDYTYDPENPILNPLEPVSFFNTLHMYNKYTISQWYSASKDDPGIEITSNIL